MINTLVLYTISTGKPYGIPSELLFGLLQVLKPIEVFLQRTCLLLILWMQIDVDLQRRHHALLPPRKCTSLITQ